MCLRDFAWFVSRNRARCQLLWAHFPHCFVSTSRYVEKNIAKIASQINATPLRALMEILG
jgi:hypothetical protein